MTTPNNTTNDFADHLQYFIKRAEEDRGEARIRFDASLGEPLQSTAFDLLVRNFTETVAELSDMITKIARAQSEKTIEQGRYSKSGTEYSFAELEDMMQRATTAQTKYIYESLQMIQRATEYIRPMRKATPAEQPQLFNPAGEIPIDGGMQIGKAAPPTVLVAYNQAAEPLETISAKQEAGIGGGQMAERLSPEQKQARKEESRAVRQHTFGKVKNLFKL